MQTPRDIARAHWQLWAVTFTIIASLAGGLIFLASGQPGDAPSILPPRTVLVVALGALIAAFALYAVDRERNLLRLARRVLEDEVERERLAARVRVLDELTRAQDMNAALLERSADGIAVVDGDLALQRFNPAMEALTGVTAADALGRRADDVLRFADADGRPVDGTGHPLRALFTDGAPRSGLELQLMLDGGGQRWVSATVSPVEGPDRTPVLALVVLRDISSRKEQERMQRDFVSMAAHELRTPLTAIKGFARTLLVRGDQVEEARRRSYLRLIDEQSDRLARLVDDLMQVSRIEAGRLELSPEPVELESLVRGVVARYTEKWSGRPIEIHADPPPVAYADPHRVEEVLINLIDNAVKYSPDGSPVRVEIQAARDEAEVAVSDRGRGFSMTDAANLFQKFRRLQNGTDVAGTGLGLFIVKGIVETHGGRVWADAAPDRGATFRFTLPLARSRDEAATA